MSNTHNLKVGQKLYMVTTTNRDKYGGNESWATITKIGRKWATLEGYRERRVDLEKLFVDGGNYSSPAQCYLTSEEYWYIRNRGQCWDAIGSYARGRYKPPECSIEDMEKVCDLLGIDKPKRGTEDNG